MKITRRAATRHNGSAGTGAGATAAARRGASERLPLWLTRGEADALILLSYTSPLSSGGQEGRLFDRLGRLRDSFQTAQQGETSGAEGR